MADEHGGRRFADLYDAAVERGGVMPVAEAFDRPRAPDPLARRGVPASTAMHEPAAARPGLW